LNNSPNNDLFYYVTDGKFHIVSENLTPSAGCTEGGFKNCQLCTLEKNAPAIKRCDLCAYSYARNDVMNPCKDKPAAIDPIPPSIPRPTGGPTDLKIPFNRKIKEAERGSVIHLCDNGTIFFH
jgi:hypothetical protein